MRLIGAVATVVLVVGGLALTGYGVLELWLQHGDYQVGFKHSGDGCGVQKVQLSLESGRPLFCTSLPTAPAGTTAAFPGFTEEQNSDVIALAEQLADDGGLSADDQEQIQDQVDAYARSVAPEARPRHGFWWGTTNLAGGLGALGLGALLRSAARTRTTSRVS
ncbi:hypothetical protein AB0E69_38165 [Kribbella sp. NPDC026611]|uniref:hypothetical protein n=1 Tax=Kribbella sp. NPDC026611 TaxID=3154911 RepID=UPI0033E328D2